MCFLYYPGFAIFFLRQVGQLLRLAVLYIDDKEVVIANDQKPFTVREPIGATLEIVHLGLSRAKLIRIYSSRLDFTTVGLPGDARAGGRPHRPLSEIDSRQRPGLTLVEQIIPGDKA